MKNILVCVTQQKTCERLISSAYELSNEYKGSLFIINVVKNDLNFLDSVKESEALEYLFSISKNLGANLAVLKSNDIISTIVQYAIENEISCIILGKSPNENNGNYFPKRLKNMLGDSVEIRILS